MTNRRRLLSGSAVAASLALLAALTGCTGDSAPSPSSSSTPVASPAPTADDPDTDATDTPDPATSNAPSNATAKSGFAAGDPGSPRSGVIETPVRVAVVGDSNSTGHDANLAAGVADDLAYIAQIQGPDITFAGGWAKDGATSVAMAKNVQPLPNVDVLVIMAGTNDTALSITTEQLTANLMTIVNTINPKYVVLAGIPPLNARPNYPIQLNADLEKIAHDNKWFFHNSWGQLTGSDNKWLPQYMVEGIHTTKEGYGVMGNDMKSYILSTFVGK